MSLFHAKSGVDWKSSVLKAVEEVLSHPLGGKVEVMVYPQAKPGDRRVVGHVSLWGSKQFQMELSQASD